jgi:hypothetical protein
MEIQEATLKNFGTSHRIQLFENKVLFHYKNLFYECHDEYEYVDLKPKIIRETEGDDLWIKAGGYFLSAVWIWLLFLILLTATVNPGPGDFNGVLVEVFVRLSTGIGLLLLLLSVTAFSLRLVKYEYFLFFTKQENIAFHIKSAHRDKAIAEKISESILNKIKERES